MSQTWRCLRSRNASCFLSWKHTLATISVTLSFHDCLGINIKAISAYTRFARSVTLTLALGWLNSGFFTPPRNRGGVIFLLQFVCLCVCVSVCMSVCEQNADRPATPILTQSSLNSCLLQSLEPY